MELEEILNKEVKIYNIQEFINEYLKDSEDKYKSSSEEMAIFEKNGKGLIVDYEAVGKKFSTLEDKITLELSKIIEQTENGNTLQLGYSIDIPIKEILENTKFKVVKMKDFFTRYNHNSRCIYNFNSMIEEIQELKIFERKVKNKYILIDMETLRVDIIKDRVNLKENVGILDIVDTCDNNNYTELKENIKKIISKYE